MASAPGTQREFTTVPPAATSTPQRGAARAAGVARVLGVVFALPAVLAATTPPRAVTVTAGTNIAATTSPTDGSVVIDLQGRLWRLPASGGAAEPLTDGLGDDRLPQFRPDGGAVVFQSFRAGSFDLWAIDAAGGNARALTSGPADDREPVYAADGRAVVFASDRDGTFDIFRLDPASGVITALVSGPGDDYWPAVAPDGAALAFVSDRGGRPALWLQRANGVPERLTGPVAGRPAAPAFSPDGRRLAFVAPVEQLAFPAVARQQLFVTELATGNTLQLSAADEDVFPLRPEWLDADRLRYTADGAVRTRRLGATGHEDLAFRATLPFARRAPVRARAVPLGGAVAGIVEPVVNPRTGTIVFQALGDLWEQSADGGVRRLTDDAAVERDPAFSPDGQRLAYLSDREGSLQLFVRELATGGERRVTRLPRGLRYPVYSADGNAVYVQQAGPRGNQDFTLHAVDLRDGSVRALRAPGLWPGRMGVSADGGHLLATLLTAPAARFREGRNALLRIDLVTGERHVEPLGDGPGSDAGISVSPDGSFAALTVGGVLHGLPLAADGRAAGPLRRWGRSLPGGLADYPAFGPGGRSIVYLGADGLRELALGRDYTPGRSRRRPVELTWAAARRSGRLVVQAGRVFTGDDDHYRRDVDVVIDDGRITAVQPARAWPAGMPIIDARDAVVLPGLFDHHVHFQAHDGGWPGPALLAFGVTSVVEPGGSPYESREQLEAWASGRRDGPRLFMAGPQLDGDRRFFPFAIQAPTRARLAAELTRARRLDYRLLKTYTRLPDDLQREVIAAGARLGIPVSSHEVYPALALGGQRVEHLRGTSRLGYSPKQSDLLRGYDDVTGIVGRSGATIVPTLAVGGGFIDYVLTTPGVLDLPQVALLPESERRNLAALPALVGSRRGLLHAALANARATLRDLHAAGATVVAGTDAPIFSYGLALHAELANHAAAGLPPAAVLRSATSVAADAIGAGADLGRVAPGRLADLVVVTGDPLARPGDLARIRLVLLAGRPVAGTGPGAP